MEARAATFWLALAAGCGPTLATERADAPSLGTAAACDAGDEAAAADWLVARRLAAGLATVGCGDDLGALAASHARFLAANEDLALADEHTEVYGRPHFSGETLAERADAHDVSRRGAWLAESVGGEHDVDAVLGAQLGTIYHRSPLMAPGLVAIGFARVAGRLQHAVLETLVVAGPDGGAPAIMPYDGMTDVPVAFHGGGERPDPVPDLRRPGWPVSVHFPRVARGAASVVVESFVVEGPDGAVDGRVLTHAADPLVESSDVFFVPRAPLAAKSRYTARVALRHGTSRADRTWTFETADGP